MGRIQGTTVNVTAAQTTLSPALTGIAAGNTLILSVVDATQTTGYAASGVSGAGATWYRGVSTAGTVGIIDIWIGLNATGSGGSQTVTVTMQASATAGCQLDEWSGISGIPVLEASAIAGATSTAPALTLTPLDVGDVLYVLSDGLSESASPASPWSTLAGPTTAGVQKNGIAYLVATSGAAQTATWTTLSGAWTTCGVILHVGASPGYSIQNDPVAATNPAVLTAQALPDMMDSIITADAALGAGVLSGCSVSPNTGSDMNFQVGAGTALINWAPTAVAAATAQAVTAADATNPRRDLVYVTPGGALKYLAGSPAIVPCPPTLPRWAAALAMIDVPANATQIDATTSTAQGHVIDKRVLLGIPITANYYKMRSGALAETFDRSQVINANVALTPGGLYLDPIVLPAGVTIGHIAYYSHQAISTPTHWWFALFDNNRNMLAITADQTNGAWAANTEKSLAIAKTAEGASSTFTTAYTGLHYIAFAMVASTMIKPDALTFINTGAASLAPILGGLTNTGATTPPAFPFTATSFSLSSGGCNYGYVAV